MSEGASTWLGIAAVVQAASAIAIVGLTWRLARATRQYADTTDTMARLASQSLVLQSLPVVIVSPAGGTWSGNSGTRDVIATNTGGGTAVNVQATLEALVADHREQLPHTFVLGPGENEKHPIRTSQRTIYESTGRFRCVADYQDILGNRYRTKREPSGGLTLTRIAVDGSETTVTLG